LSEEKDDERWHPSAIWLEEVAVMEASPRRSSRQEEVGAEECEPPPTQLEAAGEVAEVAEVAARRSLLI
jgi:hypothetical protein